MGATIIPEPALARLLAWFSPANPIGAYSYSHGLEALCEAGALADARAARDAIAVALTDGAGRTDAILTAHAWRAVHARDAAAFEHVRGLAVALSASRERREETLHQGEAFVEVVAAAWPCDAPPPAPPLPLPVAVGALGAAHGVPLAALLFAATSAYVANLVSAAVRLVPLGQTDGQRITAALAPEVAEVAAGALGASLDDVGGAALGLDVAAMRHETQHVRLFRS
ncbi:urease accessory protein UreF [Acuticoccus sp.]|uniref:urease accessory protein UreF n=1 Tax=Acuticoccus sp. TaxID=1904378 RepID=UPI003B527F48